MSKSLGEILRGFRTEQGRTQEEVAHRSGLERTHVSMIERSVYMPTVKTFFAYCEGVGASPADVAEQIHKELGPSSNWPNTNPPKKSD